MPAAKMRPRPKPQVRSWSRCTDFIASPPSIETSTRKRHETQNLVDRSADGVQGSDPSPNAVLPMTFLELFSHQPVHSRFQADARAAYDESRFNEPALAVCLRRVPPE